MIVHKIIYTKDIEAIANSLIVYIFKDTFAFVVCTDVCISKSLFVV
jgi:hypothetical protein